MDSQGDLQEILITQDAKEGVSNSGSANSTGNKKVTYFDKFIYC